MTSNAPHVPRQAPAGQVYRCYFCNTFQTTNGTDMMNHWNNESPIVCTVRGCGLSLPCWGIYSVHAQTAHTGAAAQPDGDTVQCPHCRHTFPTEQRLRMHFGNGAPQVCTVQACGQVYGCSTALMIHVARVHEPRRA